MLDAAIAVRATSRPTECSLVGRQLKLPPQDVIFAHSFFSHIPETIWARWLKALANALASAAC